MTKSDAFESATPDNKAAILRSLHLAGNPLVVPNAWDAASARLVEAAGFRAVATSSFATAEVLGYADGESAPVGDVFAAATRIARSVTLPVTIDLERGYALDPEELVERFAATGAVGMNLEDSDPPNGQMVDATEQSEFLASVRAAALSAGIDLVINARTDAFQRRAGSAEAQLSASIDRGRRYLAAGADCVFPIGASNPVAIQALVDGIPGPVNVGYGQGGLSVAQLAAMGVARVSYGPILQIHLYRKFLSALLAAVAAGENPWAV
jgi:2-methylisocitrate lyase-like PEP mutase family enzyme